MTATPTIHGSLVSETQKRISHVVFNVLSNRCTWKRAGAGSSVKPGLFFAGAGLVTLAKDITDAIAQEVDAMIEEAVERERLAPPF